MMNEDDGAVLLVKENQERQLREQRKKLEMWSRGGKIADGQGSWCCSINKKEMMVRWNW